MRSLTNGQAMCEVPGSTVGAAIEALDGMFPGIRDRLVEEGRPRPGLALFVDGEQAALGLAARIEPSSEVYFAPAISGG